MSQHDIPPREGASAGGAGSFHRIPAQRRGGVDRAPGPTGGTNGDGPEQQMARRPEGPAHERHTGLFATLKRTVTEFQADNGTVWAAALTYYAVLSVFPALIAMISVVGLVGDPQAVTDNLTELASGLGPSIAEAVRGPIQGLTSSPGAAGVLLIVGLMAALFTASGYIGAFSRASNAMYEVEEGRPFYTLRPLQMLVTLVQVVLLAVVAIGLAATGPLATSIGSAFGISGTVVLAWRIAKWPAIGVLVLLAIGLLYYTAPNARVGGFRSVLPGAALGMAVWLLASVAFAVYLANFSSYNETYGTLGGVIAFLVWLWITNVAIVLGVEFNAERERSREIADGVPGAERGLQLESRKVPTSKKRSRTG